ncbi:MAG: oligosaccharide flippase family protein [Acidobacteriota bacterium]
MSAERSVTRRILGNTLWLLSARGLSMPLAFVESIVVARLLGVATFGVLGIVITIVTVTKRLLSFRMNEFVVKYLAEAQESEDPKLGGAVLKGALLTEGVTAGVAFLLIAALAPWTADRFLGDPQAARWIITYGLIVLAEAMIESTTGALQAFDRFALQARFNVLRRLIILLAVVAASLLDGGLGEVIAAYLLGHGTIAIASLVATHREAVRQLGADWWKASWSLLGERWREMRRFTLFTNFGATLSLIIKEADLLWISFFQTPTEAGYYKLAMSLLKVPFAAASPMVKSVYPELSKAVARRSAGAVRKILLRSTQISALWVVPVCLALALLAPWIVERFYGPEFLPAVAVVRLLLIGLGLSNLLFWTRPALLAFGRPDAAFKIAIVNAVLKVALAITLLPIAGYLALAGILSGLYLVGIALSLVVIARELKRLRGLLAGGSEDGPEETQAPA